MRVIVAVPATSAGPFGAVGADEGPGTAQAPVRIQAVPRRRSSRVRARAPMNTPA